MDKKQGKGITKSWKKERRRLVITFILISIAVVCCTAIIIKMTVADISAPRAIWLKDAQSIRLFAVQEGTSAEVSLTEKDQAAIQEAFSGQNLEKMSIFTAPFKSQYDYIIEYEDARTLISTDQRKGYCNVSDGEKLYFELTEEQMSAISNAISSKTESD